MLAARDQENLVYSHQLNAAGKSLNKNIPTQQSLKPRERAPKTPFKQSLNDENKITAYGAPKTGPTNRGKGDENLGPGKTKDGKLDNQSFVTPMGKRWIDSKS
jgi:hypothetical protein